MKDEFVKKKLSCDKFRRDLYHMQAGELSQAEQLALAGHAGDCSCCGRLLAFEEAFLRGLKRRLSRAPAPPELRASVREALDRESVPVTFRAWLRAPWLVPAAAALALALLLVPALARIGSGVRPVDREVVLVDLDCDRAGLTFEQQRRCTNPLHLNAFKVGPGKYWTIGVDPDSDHGLVVDRNARGHRLHVVGDLYTRIRTLHVTSHTDKGAVGLSTDLGAASRIAARVLPDP